MTEALSLSLDVSAVPVRPGGAGYYTIALARGLSDRQDVDLTLISRRHDQTRWQEMAGDRATVVGAVADARPARLVFEQIGFPRLLRSLGVSIHHAPHYTMPGRAPMPCAVTIHDCTFFDHPEWHVHAKAAFFRRAIRRAALHAGVLICVSEATSDRLQASCEVRAPIVVAPHGVDHHRFAPTEPAPGADLAALAGIGVPTDRPLAVFIGTLEPRKGVAALVAAFDVAAGTHRDAVLVLGGQMGWGLAETERTLGAARHADRIIRTGYLPDEAVPALLRRASLVVYPALEEGFGLPALEALACGAPLVTTEGSAMAEMAQGAATLVAPGDVAMLTEALLSGLAHNGDEARRQLGLSVAAGRTWEASVALHLRAYEIALGGSQ
jgi:glycosyltransferase involved in cell wall biosynthesis